MTQDEKQATMLEKIVKLLRKAESTTPEEAEAITAKAQELMTTYAINEEMIRHASGEKPTEVVMRKDIDLGKSIYMVAHINLATNIASANNCKLVQSRYGNRASIWVIGFESDIARVELLLASLLIQQARALEAFKKNMPSYLSGSEKWKQRRAFAYGFGVGVGDKLRRANKQAEVNVVEEQVIDVSEEEREQAREVANSGMQLVLASKRQRVTSWYDEHIAPMTQKTRSRGISLGDGGAYGQGRAAGKNANTGDPSLRQQKAIG